MDKVYNLEITVLLMSLTEHFSKTVHHFCFKTSVIWRPYSFRVLHIIRIYGLAHTRWNTFPNVLFDEKQGAIEFAQVDTKIFGKITERPSGNSVLQASEPPAPVNSICKWKPLKCLHVVTCAWTIATNCISNFAAVKGTIHCGFKHGNRIQTVG